MCAQPELFFWRAVRLGIHGLWALLIVALCLLPLFLLGVGMYAEIRTDTGDLRYRFLWVPCWWTRLREPNRSELLALARDGRPVPRRWVYLCKTSFADMDNTEEIYQGMYERLPAWIRVEPEVARLALHDLANDIAEYGTYGLPGCYPILNRRLYAIEDGRWVLIDAWREDKLAGVYLKARGYTPSGQ